MVFQIMTNASREKMTDAVFIDLLLKKPVMYFSISLNDIRWGVKPNVVELSFIVRHSREGGNLFAFVFKYIKWIPAFAGMTIESTYLPVFLKSTVLGLKPHPDFYQSLSRPQGKYLKFLNKKTFSVLCVFVYPVKSIQRVEKRHLTG